MMIHRIMKDVWKNVNQATGYATQHIWCLSQARINWEGCDRKGIQHKKWGIRELGR